MIWAVDKGQAGHRCLTQVTVYIERHAVHSCSQEFTAMQVQELRSEGCNKKLHPALWTKRLL